MQGFSGVIDIKAENISSAPVDSLEIRVSGKLFPRKMSERFRLEPGESKRRHFQIETLRTGGIKLVHFTITARRGNSISAYRTQATLVVSEKVDDAKDIQIHTDSLLNLGQASERFNIGGVINVNIADMIKSGRIKTANDLMGEYEKLAPAFSPLNLEQQGAKFSGRLWRSLVAAAIVMIAFTVAWCVSARYKLAKQQQAQVVQSNAVAKWRTVHDNHSNHISGNSLIEIDDLKAGADSYMEQKQYGRAISSYTELLGKCENVINIPRQKDAAREIWQEALYADEQARKVEAEQYAEVICEEARQFLKAAEVCFNEEDFVQAQKLFENAKALLDKAKARAEKAQAEAKSNIPPEDDDIADSLKEATTQMQRGYLKEALRLVESVLESHSENKEAHQLLLAIKKKIKEKEQREKKIETRKNFL
jgi:tetratricopeptide (TPR) repeat protein